VHRTRVRNPDFIKFDIHDRVNYAVEKSFLNVDEARKRSPGADHRHRDLAGHGVFRDLHDADAGVRKAAAFLGCQFGLTVNGNRLT
jgi:hypothetical protein